MFAVSSAEGIVHIHIGIAGQCLGKLLLTLLHFSLSLVIFWIGLVDTHRLAFLFGIETQVFEQESLAGLQCSSLVGSLGAVGSKLHLHAQPLAHCINDLLERQRRNNLALWLAHVAHNDEAAAITQDFLQGGQSSANAGIVGDLTLIVQRNVEVNTHKCFFSSKIVVCNVSHFNES